MSLPTLICNSGTVSLYSKGSSSKSKSFPSSKPAFFSISNNTYISLSLSNPLLLDCSFPTIISFIVSLNLALTRFSLASIALFLAVSTESSFSLDELPICICSKSISVKLNIFSISSSSSTSLNLSIISRIDSILVILGISSPPQESVDSTI